MPTEKARPPNGLYRHFPEYRRELQETVRMLLRLDDITDPIQRIYKRTEILSRMPSLFGNIAQINIEDGVVYAVSNVFPWRSTAVYKLFDKEFNLPDATLYIREDFEQKKSESDTKRNGK